MLGIEQIRQMFSEFETVAVILREAFVVCVQPWSL